MSNNFNFENAIQEGLRLGQEGLCAKDKIKEILESFANDLQRILSEQSNKQISVQPQHVIIRKKLSPIEALVTIGSEAPPIKEEYDGVCLFDESTAKDPFVVFRYEIDPISGYPCKIRYSSNLFSCKDETALIVTIKDVMKYRGLAISEKVRELVKNSNKEEKQ